MSRITVKDLEAEHEVSKEEMRKVFGGGFLSLNSPYLFPSGISFSSRLKTSRLGIVADDGSARIGIVADDGSA